jgi:hypothetical protein
MSPSFRGQEITREKMWICMICLINLLYGSDAKKYLYLCSKNIYICEQILDA